MPVGLIATGARLAPAARSLIVPFVRPLASGAANGIRPFVRPTILPTGGGGAFGFGGAIGAGIGLGLLVGPDNFRPPEPAGSWGETTGANYGTNASLSLTTRMVVPPFTTTNCSIGGQTNNPGLAPFVETQTFTNASRWELTATEITLTDTCGPGAFQNTGPLKELRLRVWNAAGSLLLNNLYISGYDRTGPSSGVRRPRYEVTNIVRGGVTLNPPRPPREPRLFVPDVPVNPRPSRPSTVPPPAPLPINPPLPQTRPTRQPGPVPVPVPEPGPVPAPVPLPGTQPGPITIPRPQPGITPSPTPIPSPTPAPSPTPTPSPAPSPSPAPAPSPTPAPSPNPDPNTSPDPDPFPDRPLTPRPLPITPTPLPNRPNDPDRPTLPTRPDGTVEPAPQPGPVTRDPDVITVPGGEVGQEGSRPRADLVSIARELGKIEQKMELSLGNQLQPPEPPPPDPALQDLLDALQAEFPAGSYQLFPACDRDAQGEPLPPAVSEWPGGAGALALLNRKIDALADLIQAHKDFRQPVCRSKPIGEEVTVTFEEVL